MCGARAADSVRAAVVSTVERVERIKEPVALVGSPRRAIDDDLVERPCEAYDPPMSRSVISV